MNDQTRTLKLAELVLRELAPRVHRAIRGVYDVIGPPAARTLVHPVLADIAYLSLRPAEWIARGALRLLVPGVNQPFARLYGPEIRGTVPSTRRAPQGEAET